MAHAEVFIGFICLCAATRKSGRKLLRGMVFIRKADCDTANMPNFLHSPADSMMRATFCALDGATALGTRR